METIGDILEEKGHDVFAIAPNATVLRAVEMMCDRHVGALLVATDDATLGIVSERDLLTRVLLQERPPAETMVEQIMTRALVSVHPETSVREAMAVMIDRRCRHLPVVAEEGVIGIVSMGDLVRCASREQEFELRMLTDYVRGAYA